MKEREGRGGGRKGGREEGREGWRGERGIQERSKGRKGKREKTEHVHCTYVLSICLYADLITLYHQLLNYHQLSSYKNNTVRVCIHV